MDEERLQRLLDDPQHSKRVGWFDPPVLARSAVLVMIANIFGRHSDRRLLEALAGQPQGTFDYSRAPGDFWLDYVSDLGDGWNATYAIASAVARPELNVDAVTTAGSGDRETTHSGSVLVFGGDEVYPYPSREAYEIRTETPYALALADKATKPDIFAIPGNHDWYDSLIAFSRTFCRPERGFAGCRTKQLRSYFALHLPGNWWLLAIDLQLGADLDEPQVRYFQQVAEAMEDGARIILCVPEPQWILREHYPDDPSYKPVALDFLEQKVFKRRIDVFLTGDLHHYRRHENADGVQKIVSGGGGAFLHPTHVPASKSLRDGFKEKAAYPDRGTSWRLAWRNVLFPFLNPRFFWLPATLYALSAWFASANLTRTSIGSMHSALGASVAAAVRDPVDGLWILGVIALFVVFTDTHDRLYRLIGGVSHALAHLLAAFAIGWFAMVYTTHGLGMPFGSVTQLLLSGVLTFGAGGFIGSLLMGLYLLGSVQIFGRHFDIAFSSLHVEDFKQWVRLRIDTSGGLTIFAFGIDKVPRAWKGGAPADPRATEPRLIDRVYLPPRKI